MNARDKLADLLEEVIDFDIEQIADVILKAGWRPPARVIETVEELEDLPRGSVLIDRQGLVHKGEAIRKYSRFLLRRFGPLTLLWEPCDDDE